MDDRSLMPDQHAPTSAPAVDRQSSQVLGLFDFCKGLAIVGVVLVHVLHGWFGWQGVHVFIVLSGFGLCYSRRRAGATQSWRQWFMRRAERILPTYWLVALCGYVLVLVAQALWPPAPAYIVARPTANLLLDLSLLRNLSYRGMFGYPNASLWYVPLIVGCYAVFPALMALVLRQRTRAGLLRLLLAGLVIEALSRAVALYALDGMPVGYGHGFWPGLPKLDAGRDLVPAAFPFQLWAPFGLFLTRIGEFLAGMIAADLFVRDERRMTGVLLSPWAALTGLLLWLGGNALLYVGLWGWVVADALIAVGLTLALLNLAAATRRVLRGVFRSISVGGRWSHELFLTHLMVMYVYAVSYPYLAPQSLALNVVLLLLTALAIGVACRLVRRFDRSRWPSWIIHATIGKLWIDSPASKEASVETPQRLRSGS